MHRSRGVILRAVSYTQYRTIRMCSSSPSDSTNNDSSDNSSSISYSNWVESALTALRRGKLPKVRQVGDPVLRELAEPVTKNHLESKDFQKFASLLVHTMRERKACGISAPQVGVPLRVIAIEFTKDDIFQSLHAYGEKRVKELGMQLVPLHILCNPTLTITDGTQVSANEGCLSLHGHFAAISRATAIRVDAMDLEGRAVSINADRWTARMFQHELDHIDGTLYIDHMTCQSSLRSFANEQWEKSVDKSGKGREVVLFDPSWFLPEEEKEQDDDEKEDDEDDGFMKFKD